MKVTIAGSLSKDINKFARNRVARLGGAVIHSAVAYKELGVELVAAFCSTSEDLIQARRFLGERVLIHHQVSEVTTGFENRYAENGRRTQKILALAPTIQTREVGRDVDVVHLSPLHHFDLSADWLKLDAVVAIDVQGLLRPARLGTVSYRCIPGIETYLEGADFIKASEREMAFLLNHLGMDEPQFANRYPGTEILISAGARGGRILNCPGVECRWNAEALDAAVDTTGAGDIFFAAFLVYRQAHPGYESAGRAAELTGRLLRNRRADP